MPRLKPRVVVNRIEHRLITTDMTAVPATRLGKRIGSLEDQRLVIINAIDFLLQGF